MQKSLRGDSRVGKGFIIAFLGCLSYNRTCQK